MNIIVDERYSKLENNNKLFAEGYIENLERLLTDKTILCNACVYNDAEILELQVVITDSNSSYHYVLTVPFIIIESAAYLAQLSEIYAHNTFREYYREVNKLLIG